MCAVGAVDPNWVLQEAGSLDRRILKDPLEKCSRLPILIPLGYFGCAGMENYEYLQVYRWLYAYFLVWAG